jgi:predicted permease
MWAVVEGFSTIAAVVAVGYLLARAGITGRPGQRALGDIAFYVAQPALVLRAVSEAELGVLFGWHVVAFGLACIVTGLSFAAIRRRQGATRAEATIGYLATSYVNAANLGLPIAAFVLGDAAWAAPAMLLQVLVLQPSAIASLEASSAGPRRSVLRTFVTHPMVLGGVLGLALNLSGWQPPSLVWGPLALIADLAIPAMLLAFGLSLHSNPLPRLHRMPRSTQAAIATKAVVVPAVALATGLALGLTSDQLRAAVVLAALPTAQVVFVHALRYRVGLGMVQATTVWSTLLSVPVILAAGTLL